MKLRLLGTSCLSMTSSIQSCDNSNKCHHSARSSCPRKKSKKCRPRSRSLLSTNLTSSFPSAGSCQSRRCHALTSSKQRLSKYSFKMLLSKSTINSSTPRNVASLSLSLSLSNGFHATSWMIKTPYLASLELWSLSTRTRYIAVKSVIKIHSEHL